MQIQIDKDGYILGFCSIGGFENGIEVPDSFLDGVDVSKLESYKYIGTTAVFDIERYRTIEQSKKRDEIRTRREIECFSIVDRPLWVDTLTAEQRVQLKAWYQLWLNAPETMVIPEKPNFIVTGW